LELTDAWAQQQCNRRCVQWIAPVAGWRCFSFNGFLHPFPSRAYLIDPTGKLVGERSNRNQGDYHDEQK
jgi:hypothetical protein